MRRTILGTLPLLTAIAVLAGGCRTAPTPHYYLLEPPPPLAEVAIAGEGLKIGVEPFSVDPPYDQERLVYRIGAGSPEVGFYAYHRWAAPLGRLVAVAMAAGLRGTPGIAAIAPVAAGDDYEAVLSGRVVYLEEVDMPSGQVARMRLDLKLRDLAGRVLWSREVAREVAGRAETVGEVVELLRRALAGILDEVGIELSKALAE